MFAGGLNAILGAEAATAYYEDFGGWIGQLSDLDKEIEAIIFAAAEPLDVDTIEIKVSKRGNVPESLEKLRQEKKII